jgi:hypothetical protein
LYIAHPANFLYPYRKSVPRPAEVQNSGCGMKSLPPSQECNPGNILEKFLGNYAEDKA